MYVLSLHLETHRQDDEAAGMRITEEFNNQKELLVVSSPALP